MTNAIDPVDGSTIAVVDLDQLAKLVMDPAEALAEALYLYSVRNEVGALPWPNLSQVTQDRWRAQTTAEPTKMWLNAMMCVAPRDEFLLETGREIIRLLQQSPQPERDEFGLRPWKRLTVEIAAS